MRRTHLLLVLSVCALLLPIARKASATPPDAQITPSDPTAEVAAKVVEKKLVQPLAQQEARRNRFSRGELPPQARRVRVLDQNRSTDGRGAEFLAFAIDVSSGLFDSRRWRKDAIVGCVYPAREEIFIKRGDKYFGAGLLLGKKTAAAGDLVCRSAPVAVGEPRH